MRRPIIIGNWKMNGSNASNQQLLQEFAATWQGEHTADVVVCPPFPYLSQAVEKLSGSSIQVGAQDVSQCQAGAYTGDVCAEMLADLDCQYVIVGHSERRRYHQEKDVLVGEKAHAALAMGLTPVICVGEPLEQREAGNALTFVKDQLQPILAQLTEQQLERSVLAYEPIWAIGTGKSASPEQAQEVHASIRSQLGAVAEKVQIIYGGSVKPDNARELFAQPDIDGALVGGASLKAETFLAICQAAE